MVATASSINTYPSHEAADIKPELSGVEALFLRGGDKLSEKLIGRLLTPEMRTFVEEVVAEGGKLMLRGGTVTNTLYGGALLTSEGNLDPDARSDFDFVAMDAQTYEMVMKKLGIQETSADAFYARGSIGGKQVDVVSIPKIQEKYLAAAAWLEDWYNKSAPEVQEAIERNWSMTQAMIDYEYSNYRLASEDFQYNQHRHQFVGHFGLPEDQELFTGEFALLEESSHAGNVIATAGTYADWLKEVQRVLANNPQAAFVCSGLLPTDSIGVDFLADPASGDLVGRLDDPVNTLRDPKTIHGLLMESLLGEYFGIAVYKPGLLSLPDLYLRAMPYLDFSAMDPKFLPVITSNVFPRLIRMMQEQNIQFYEDSPGVPTYSSEVLYPAALALTHAVSANQLPERVENGLNRKFQQALVRASLAEPTTVVDNFVLSQPFGFCLSSEIAALFEDYHNGEHSKTGIGLSLVRLERMHLEYMRNCAQGIPPIEDYDAKLLRCIEELNLTNPKDWLSLKYGHLAVARFGVADLLVEDVGVGTTRYQDYARHPRDMSEVMAMIFTSLSLNSDNPAQLSIIKSVLANWKLSGKLDYGWLKDKDISNFETGLDLNLILLYMTELQSISEDTFYAYTRDKGLVQGL